MGLESSNQIEFERAEVRGSSVRGTQQEHKTFTWRSRKERTLTGRDSPRPRKTGTWLRWGYSTNGLLQNPFFKFPQQYEGGAEHGVFGEAEWNQSVGSLNRLWTC